MYYYDDEPTEVIGAPCSLLEDYKGCTEGRVTGDFGTSLVVQLCSGAETVVGRDDVLVYDWPLLLRKAVRAGLGSGCLTAATVIAFSFFQRHLLFYSRCFFIFMGMISE